MKYKGREQSRNIEDRRGQSSGRGGGMGKIGGGIGIGMLLLAGVIFLLGGDPSTILQQASQPQQLPMPQQQNDGKEYVGSPQEEELRELVGVTLKETEDVWHKIFQEQLGKRYQEPNLVIFTRSTSSACGHAQSATGPFYCPGDSKVYIDLDFYDQLRSKFRASGDFAMAYVVSHEIGHHIQNLLGYTDYVHKQKGRVSQEQYNDLSVRLELQADFLAGVWAHHAHKSTGLLEEGDYEEAMRAAKAIGDDNIQRQAQGYVVPESFTHGTSEQRMRWFNKGIRTGDLSQGDTFRTREL